MGVLTKCYGHGIKFDAWISWYEHPTIGAVGRTIKDWDENTIEDYYEN